MASVDAKIARDSLPSLSKNQNLETNELYHDNEVLVKYDVKQVMNLAN